MDDYRSVAERVLNPHVFRKGHNYVYFLWDSSDRLPRYVGITCMVPKLRMGQHFHRAEFKSAKFQAWLTAADVEMLIICEADRPTARQIEKDLMDHFPAGQLFNGQGYVFDEVASAKWYEQRGGKSYHQPSNNYL